MTTSHDHSLPALLGGPAEFDEAPPWPRSTREVRDALERAFADGDWGRYHGPYARRLADALSEYHDIDHVELCCSGTAAVELALRGLRVGAGDEVVLAAYDFKGNFADVLAVGATPVLVDVSDAGPSVALDQLEVAISDRTRAVLVSHLHGDMVDMTRLRAICKNRSLPIIEDACQTPGAELAGRKAGTLGDAGVLSFGGSKLLTAGRGGAVLTRRADVAQRIKLHCQRGNHAYPLSELQAAVLLPQLDQLDVDNARRASNVQRLREFIDDLDGLRAFCTQADAKPGYYKLGFSYDPSCWSGLSRDRWVEAMRAEGVAFSAGFRALHASHAARRFRAAGDLSHAARADASYVVLHHPILLETHDPMLRIARALRKVKSHAGRIAKLS